MRKFTLKLMIFSGTTQSSEIVEILANYVQISQGIYVFYGDDEEPIAFYSSRLAVITKIVTL